MKTYKVYFESDHYSNEVNEANETLEKTFRSHKEAVAYADQLCLKLAKCVRDDFDYAHLRDAFYQECEYFNGNNAITIDIAMFSNGDWVENELHSMVVGNY